MDQRTGIRIRYGRCLESRLCLFAVTPTSALAEAGLALVMALWLRCRPTSLLTRRIWRRLRRPVAFLAQIFVRHSVWCAVGTSKSRAKAQGFNSGFCEALGSTWPCLLIPSVRPCTGEACSPRSGCGSGEHDVACKHCCAMATSHRIPHLRRQTPAAAMRTNPPAVSPTPRSRSGILLHSCFIA